MKAIGRGAVISAAVVLLLGASLALSSAGAVSGAKAMPQGRQPQPQPTATSCNSSIVCFSETNSGSGGAILGSATNYSIQGVATNDFSVYGTASSFAIYGNATASEAVGGVASNYAVVGNATKNYGVYATASNYGVYGVASNYGVYGAASNYAVYGTASQLGGVGAYGQSTASAGIGVEGVGAGTSPVLTTHSVAVLGYSSSSTGIAGDFVNNSTTSAALVAYNGTGYPFEAYGPSGFSYVDGSGDGFFTGKVTATGGFQTEVRTRDGENLGASTPMTPQATMEDTGTARLLNGEGAVRFDPAFASTIDASRGYQVFLTPNGETRGWLYVAAKYERGFIVREAEHGRSSVYFDYRVVAHPYGASDARLPQLNLKRPPIPPLTRHAQPQQPPRPPQPPQPPRP
ncbi:MAG: hypothetical protein JO113_08625 [Candidatus Eremiobacteraeota bacterium]|nr:hypothetical protein [Candidatus Eremiobacteraeota bacterium]